MASELAQSLSFATTDYAVPGINVEFGGMSEAKIFNRFQKRQQQGNGSPFQPHAGRIVRLANQSESNRVDEQARKKLRPSGRTTSWDEAYRQSEAEVVALETESLVSYIRDELIQGFIASTGFRMFSLVIIVLNSILVGVQTNESLERAYAWELNTLDYIFLTIFTMEIVLKWIRGFGLFWKSGWNVFDFVLVAISLVGQGLSFMSSGRVLRILRVLRAFRTIRSIRMVRGLQMIVNTVFRSLPDMGNIFMLMGIVMYIFAIVGVTLFKDYVPYHFGSLPLAMYTLYVALTQDGWAKIYVDMDRAGLTTQSSIYFFLFIIIGAFIFMNIISGVIVTNFQHAHEEHRRTTQLKFRSLGNPEPPWEKATTNQAAPQHEHCNPNRVTAPTRLPPATAIKSLYPSFSEVEQYILTVAAMEKNKEQYDQLLSSLSTTIAKVHDFNMVLSSDATRSTTTVSAGWHIIRLLHGI